MRLAGRGEVRAGKASTTIPMVFSMVFSTSFFTAGGTGFEAFFTAGGVLVVAVCTKKDYMTVALPEFAFSDSAWVRIVQFPTPVPIGDTAMP